MRFCGLLGRLLVEESSLAPRHVFPLLPWHRLWSSSDPQPSRTKSRLIFCQWNELNWLPRGMAAPELVRSRGQHHGREGERKGGQAPSGCWL